MARQFNGTTQRLEASFSIAMPLTISAWFRSPNVSGNYNAVSVGVAGGSDRSRCALHIRGGSDAVSARVTNSAGTEGQAISAGNYTANVWYHGCTVFTSATSRAAFINGGSKGTNTANIVLGTVTKVTVGAAETTTGTYIEYFPGNLANVGIWNVALTDGEVAELGTGVGCNTVRPDALLAWYKLIDADGDVDWWGQNNLTAANSPTYVQHPPPIHYPSGIRITTAAAAPPAASTSNNLLLLGVG